MKTTPDGDEIVFNSWDWLTLLKVGPGTLVSHSTVEIGLTGMEFCMIPARQSYLMTLPALTSSWRLA